MKSKKTWFVILVLVGGLLGVAWLGTQKNELMSSSSGELTGILRLKWIVKVPQGETGDIIKIRIGENVRLSADPKYSPRYTFEIQVEDSGELVGKKEARRVRFRVTILEKTSQEAWKVKVQSVLSARDAEAVTLTHNGGAAHGGADLILEPRF